LTGFLIIVFLIVAGIFLSGAVILFIRGLKARSSLADRAYGVERQEVRHEMLASFTRSAVFLFIALIVFAIYGLVPRDEEIEPVATVTRASLPIPTIEADGTLLPSPSTPPTRASGLTTPTTTATPDVQSTRVNEPSQVPTNTLLAKTAVVNSFNGLWLRSESDPEGDQLELIPNETVLIVLQEDETTDQTEWQQVRSPSGLEGWVFKQFILYQLDE
jgi:hypothetical protein